MVPAPAVVRVVYTSPVTGSTAWVVTPSTEKPVRAVVPAGRATVHSCQSVELRVQMAVRPVVMPSLVSRYSVLPEPSPRTHRFIWGWREETA